MFLHCSINYEAFELCFEVCATCIQHFQLPGANFCLRHFVLYSFRLLVVLKSISIFLRDEMNKERNAEDKSLLLAAENAECMSHRLRNKAQTLRNLSNNAKTW